MSCIISSLLNLIPRLAFLIFWIVPAGRVKVFNAFSTWVWPLLGLIFLPWTALIYVIFFPIVGIDWLWLALALLVDLGSYGSGFAIRTRTASSGGRYGYGGPESASPSEGGSFIGGDLYVGGSVDASLPGDGGTDNVPAPHKD